MTCFAIPQVPALDHKNTLVFLNKFITHTTQFLNKFSTVCEEVGPYTIDNRDVVTSLLSMLIQRGVTYTWPVEAFAARIKMESSNQRSF